jgi:hypothetical protein
MKTDVSVEEVPTLTREQRFRNIISDYNEKMGFDFTLDELNPDESYKYAHATHTDKDHKITSQMDTDSKIMYALYVTFEGSDRSLPLPDGMTKKQVYKTSRSEAFKTRMGTMSMLSDLQKRLYKEIDRMSDSIFDESLAESEKQDAYDIIMLVARKLLRDNA